MLPFVGGGSSGGVKAVLAYMTQVQQGLLEDIKGELKTLTHFVKEGLNVQDEPSDIRLDVQDEAEE